MKKINLKNSFLLVGMVGLLFTACDDGDKVIDAITDQEARGAVLRTIDVLSNSVAINSATNELQPGENFSVILEEQDQENGALLQEVEVYLSFEDNSGEDTNSKAETLISTIPASAFTTGSRGLPQYTYTIEATEMQSALGLAGADIGFGGDQFIHRFALKLTDGRTFSLADNSGTLTGSYFSAPWRYAATVVCAPSVPTAGTWTISTVDSYGDGWNGGKLEVVIDGGDAIEITNTDSGGPYPTEITQNFDVEVPDGAQTISIIYRAGSFDSEVSFEVTSANGNKVVDVGPGPGAGAELLDYCPDNL